MKEETHVTDVSREQIRLQVWERLRRVARPDSRFHWNFEEFIPDFEGSDRCAASIRAMREYRDAQFIFVTPDNNLSLVRTYCMEDGKDLLVSTYGIARGFFLVEAGRVARDAMRFAASLDGLEEFGRPVSLSDIKARGPLDLLVTGASAITCQGVRLGKGHGYFDLEWAMLTEIGAAAAETPIIGVVHDCQLVDVEMKGSSHDTIVDIIVTPTQVITVQSLYPKPKGVVWDRLPPSVLEAIPPLAELRDMIHRGEKG